LDALNQLFQQNAFAAAHIHDALIILAYHTDDAIVFIIPVGAADARLDVLNSLV
jgi:hypothetical protein